MLMISPDLLSCNLMTEWLGYYVALIIRGVIDKSVAQGLMGQLLGYKHIYFQHSPLLY